MNGGISSLASKTLGLVGKIGGFEAEVVLGLVTEAVEAVVEILVLIGGDTCRRLSFETPELLFVPGAASP